MKIIDTHCHLDITLFEAGLDELVHRTVQAGVFKCVIPGYVNQGWQRIFAVCAAYPGVLFPAIGLHPIYLDHHNLPHDINSLQEFCSTHRPIAIGEIGMDFQNGRGDEEMQRALFTKQLHIAKDHALPALLHVRKAHDQVLSIIRKTCFPNGGIVHAFNGSMQQAEQYIDNNFKLGYGGNLTYERALRIRQLAATLPLHSIVLETDAPDIPLSHRRNEPNLPEYLPEILETLALLRTETKAEIAHQTTLNAYEALPLIS